MTESEINIAIAEACGWQIVDVNVPVPSLVLDNKTVVQRKWKSPDGRNWHFTPNYCNDLNAMAEAEKTLDRLSWDDYTRALRAIIQRDCNTSEHYVLGCERSQLIADFWFYRATAQQRAEAFYKVITKHPENKKDSL